MDDARREIADGAVFVRNNVIEAVGPSDTLPATADEVIDARDQIVLPGLVNTHHHFYQTLTRVLPAAQDAELFDWLQVLYPVWARLTPEMAFVSTQTAAAELLLSGCTTSSDHLYLFPNGTRLDDTLEAAAQIGIRFHAARGAMSVGQSQGGLPPDSVVEPEETILRDTERLITRWHDPARHAMQRIVVAPCSPFSVSPGLMRDAAALARRHGVSLHTHLAENHKDIAYTRKKFHCTPAEYAEQLGWARTSGTRTACSWMRRASRCSRAPAPAWRIARAPTCGWPRASRPSVRCATPACPWAWRWTARPATTAATCWPRRGWPCCCSAWATGPPH